MSNLGGGEAGGFLNESSMTTRDFAKNQSMSKTLMQGEFKVHTLESAMNTIHMGGNPMKTP
jgi:hypothetical protein